MIIARQEPRGPGEDMSATEAARASVDIHQR